MTKTNFANPHGLMNNKNYSNCEDLAKLCTKAWKNKLFREIVGTKIYQCNLLNNGLNRVVVWKQSNKLLFKKNFTGLKTGWTFAANSCLAATYFVKETQ